MFEFKYCVHSSLNFPVSRSLHSFVVVMVTILCVHILNNDFQLLMVPSDGSCAIAQLRTCLLVSITVSCLSDLVSSQLAVPFYAFFGAERAQVSQRSSRSREEQWTDSGRGLRNDQLDRSLPRGRELNLDFTGR